MSEKIEIDKKDLAERDKKITKQQEELEALKADMKKLSRNSNASIQLESGDQELLGELADPIRKMISSAISGITDEMSGSFKKIQTSISGLQDNINQQNQSLFSGVASSTLRNYPEVTKSSEFKEFMDGRVKGVGVTWGDSWASAKKSNDISTMQEIIDAFLDTDEGASFRPENRKEASEDDEHDDENNSAGAETIEPKGSASSSGNTNPKWKFKVSDFQDKLDLYKRRELSEADFEGFKIKFNEAVDAGQVLDDRQVAEQ